MSQFHRWRFAKEIGLLFVAVVTLASDQMCSAAGLQADRLRCERLTTPLGIQTLNPHLDWIVTSDERNQAQSAYRILVATNPEKLEQQQADLWDSGKVQGDQTLDVVYSGKPLDAHQVAYWKVGVWDKNGDGPVWSETSHWSFGFPEGAEWQAKWIGCDQLRKIERQPGNFTDASWITAPEQHDPGQWRLFTTKWNLPDDIRIASAEFLIGGDDRCEVHINGVQVTHELSVSRPFRRHVEEVLVGGENDVRLLIRSHEGRTVGLIARLVVTDADGEEHILVTGDHWQVAVPAEHAWAAGDVPEDRLVDCRARGPAGVEPWGELESPDLILPPPIHLRSVATIEKPVRRATLYATALGNCDMYLNGERVSDEYFTPGWTDYTRRVYYRAYDVTDRVKVGENAWGGCLADGWYAGHVAWGFQRNHYGDQPRLRAQLHVEYEDGTTADFGTNDAWRASTGGTHYGDFLMGESHDARQAEPDWSTASFDASDWSMVDVGSNLSPLVQVHPAPPVRVLEEFKPVEIAEPRPGMHVVDLGQNFAGVVRLRVDGRPGQKVRLRYGERLNPDGTVYFANLRTARATDTYICKGEGTEEWQPRFTFHGFQYVEIMGLEEPPTEETIVGLPLSSDAPIVRSFACSNEMLNQLHSNIYWTQRSNFIDIPTDCPQRDERLGWTGDAQVYVATASLNVDVQAFFNKWLVDLEDAQFESGQYPSVAPRKGTGEVGGPAWSDAGIICPWTIYQVYGDRRVLERQYDSMKRFIEFYRQQSEDETLPPDNFHCYGDWLSINAPTPTPVIYTAYYAQSTRLLSRAAEVLGKEEDAREYQELYERIRTAFNDRFVGENGRIEGNTQCCYVLALAFDLLNENNAKRAGEYLVEDIEQRGGVLSTGFVGTKDLMLVLSKIGRQDVAYQLLESDKFPSWGFSIKHGATSIWERWDGWTPENGFQTPNMNSFAHYAFGAVDQWVVENIGGIRANEPGYRSITIAPEPGGSLTWADTKYHSVRGDIQTKWEMLADNGLRLEVTVPANTTADVHLPCSEDQQVREGDTEVANADSVQGAERQGGKMVVRIGSGSYVFTVE